MRQPTIVFDIGNVLVRWDPRNLFRKTFGGDDAAMEAFLATACSHEWLLQCDAGDISATIAGRIAEFPQYREQLTQFDERWLETLDGVIEENVALLAQLKAQGRKVYGITNYSRDKFEASKPLYPFFGWFDGLIVSGCEGLAKPDPRIFARLFERYGLAPSQTLFIDDSERNILAARALGMDVIHCPLGFDLRAELLRRGVLDAEPCPPAPLPCAPAISVRG